MSERVCLKEFTPLELERWVEDAGQPAYRARQILKWLYGRGAEDFQEMTDLNKDFRSRLADTAGISCLETKDTCTEWS